MAKANNTSIASALSIDAWEMGNVTSSGTPEFSQLHLSKEQNQGSPGPSLVVPMYGACVFG